jgi:CRP-like cAMP-binding protein
MYRSNSRNLLISQLPEDELIDLLPLLEPVELPKDFTLARYNQAIDYHYFLEAGIASMVAVSPKGKKVEAGIAGREGISPVAAALGTSAMRFECMIQVAGHGHRIGTGVLHQFLRKAPGLHGLLLRFVQALLIQTSYTILINATYNVDRRLARWILMCHDRVDDNEIPVTHEFMAMMLGVRRPTLTETLHILEGHQLIRSERGVVIIRNRADLERFAGDAYGIPEAEYEQVIDARLAKRVLAPRPVLEAFTGSTPE